MTTTVLMRDGSNVTIRAASAWDEPALRSFLANLSPESRRLRFFTGAADISCAAHLAMAIGAGHYGLMAHDQDGAPVAHAIYVRLDETRAEVAVEVADHLHGQGLGTLLIQRLAARAETDGITTFVAEVLPENHAAFTEFWPSTALILLYWLIFRAAYVFRTPLNQNEENISSLSAVLNSIGVPPASRMPCFTAAATSRRWKLQGPISVHVLATPMMGLCRSSLEKPTPRR